ncbi:hypothetical protein EXIGLDRAFT_829871, partial [Exidia glandulosa HHB12029]
LIQPHVPLQNPPRRSYRLSCYTRPRLTAVCSLPLPDRACSRRRVLRSECTEHAGRSSDILLVRAECWQYVLLLPARWEPREQQYPSLPSHYDHYGLPSAL